jgi:glutamate formiminotransferase/formiminotetrahydrofolate cyclodeaminase
LDKNIQKKKLALRYKITGGEMKLVECVPNFSEGRDRNILDAIAAQVKSVKNVTLLDVDPGADTNRTVFTFVGEPEAVVEAAFLAIKKAAELIDMSKHHGAHARMGATDVCPFIPVTGMSMEECVELSKKLAKRVGEELMIPVYLYEYSASRPERVNLAEVRKGEYEALPEKMKDEYWRPDFGPFAFNEKSGATVIGAREFLIAYNINLNTRDKKKAQDIAELIREKGKLKRDANGKIVKDANGEKVFEDGLFKHCKAVGWYIDEYNRAQISMNLTNYNITPAHLVLEKVRELAMDKGVVVTGSELVGLIPRDAITMAGKYYLNRLGESAGLPERMIIETAVQSMGLAELAPFDVDKKVIEYAIRAENRLVDMTLEGFCDELSTDSPAPGGGSVAALCASMSAGLSAMVANLTINKKGYEANWDFAKPIAEEGQRIKADALRAIDDDTQAFYDMMDSMRLPKGTDEEKAIRNEAIQTATKKAIMVPFRTLEIAHECVVLASRIAKIGNTNALSDAGVAAITANAGAKAAYLNVKINMGSIEDEAFKNDILKKSEELAQKINELAIQVEKDIIASL